MNTGLLLRRDIINSNIWNIWKFFPCIHFSIVEMATKKILLARSMENYLNRWSATHARNIKIDITNKAIAMVYNWPNYYFFPEDEISIILQLWPKRGVDLLQTIELLNILDEAKITTNISYNKISDNTTVLEFFANWLSIC